MVTTLDDDLSTNVMMQNRNLSLLYSQLKIRAEICLTNVALTEPIIETSCSLPALTIPANCIQFKAVPGHQECRRHAVDTRCQTHTCFYLPSVDKKKTKHFQMCIDSKREHLYIGFISAATPIGVHSEYKFHVQRCYDIVKTTRMNLNKCHTYCIQ